jgi:hypothetical protein
VRAVNQPATTGWSGNQLILSVFPSHSQVEEIDNDYPVTRRARGRVDRLVQAEAGSLRDLVDWGAVRQAANRRNGVAVAAVNKSAMVRNEAPTYGLYGTETARSDDRRTAAAAYLHRPMQSRGIAFTLRRCLHRRSLITAVHAAALSRVSVLR